MESIPSKSIFHNAQTTLLDHPDKISLITYTRKCNWSCFGCYNMRELLKDSFVTPYTTDEILELISSPLIDMLIISGGESLLLKEELIDALKYIRNKTNKLIRVDTNGTQYETAKQLVDLKLIDGLAVDVKYPYWLGPTTMLYNLTGIDFIDTKSILKTMELADTLQHSIFRTVKYPIIQDSLINEIVIYMKQHYKSPHFVNPFYHMA